MDNDLQPVEGSSTIAAYGPSKTEPGVFSVIFKSNPTTRYDYLDVPQEVMEKVMEHSSAGSAIHSLIKKEGYAFAKVDLGDTDHG